MDGHEGGFLLKARPKLMALLVDDAGADDDVSQLDELLCGVGLVGVVAGEGQDVSDAAHPPVLVVEGLDLLLVHKAHGHLAVVRALHVAQGEDHQLLDAVVAGKLNTVTRVYVYVHGLGTVLSRCM